MSRYRLIINPISGTQSKQKQAVAGRLRDLLSARGDELEVTPTYYQGHAEELAKDAVEDGCDVLIVAGGDGTINEILPAIHHQPIALAILPFGSGNGIARSLGIPMNVDQALLLAIYGEVRSIDLGWFGKHPFLGVAGVGFDAHIARCFREQPQRGFYKYAQLILREFRSYEAPYVRLVSGKQRIESEAFILSFGNANQYGNNFYIDKTSRMDDGKLSCVLLPRMSVWQMSGMILRGFKGTVTDSSLCQHLVADHFELQCSGKDAHTDGEPFSFDGVVEVRVEKGVVRVIT